jgi:hypothetical protein
VSKQCALFSVMQKGACSAAQALILKDNYFPVNSSFVHGAEFGVYPAGSVGDGRWDGAQR